MSGPGKAETSQGKEYVRAYDKQAWFSSKFAEFSLNLRSWSLHPIKLLKIFNPDSYSKLILTQVHFSSLA